MKKLIVLLAMTMSVSAMAAADFTCGGTEPFWDLSVKGDKVTYNAFFEDESTKTEDVLSRESAVGTQEDFAVVITTATSTASIIGGECNDGMSDNVYSHSILYKSGDSVLVGCCNIAK